MISVDVDKNRVVGGLLAWAALALPAAAQDEPAKTPPGASGVEQTLVADPASPADPTATADKSGQRAADARGIREARGIQNALRHPEARGIRAHTAEHGSSDLVSMLFVFVLATFIGLGVVPRVSRLLHTPLMSITNAISAIAVVGSIIVAGGADYPTDIQILGAVALFASMTNIVSGFLITDRMLKMFKTREEVRNEIRHSNSPTSSPRCCSSSPFIG